MQDPIRKDNVEDRRTLVARELSDRNIDLAIVSDPKHIYYFTGFSTFKPGFSSFLLLESNARATLLLGESESSYAKNVFSGDIATFVDYDLEKRMIAYTDYVSLELERTLKEIAGRNNGLRNVAIENWILPKEYSDTVERVFGSNSSQSDGLSEIILSMRKVKGEGEVDFIRDAAKRLDLAHKTARALCKPGNTEFDLYREMNDEIFRRYGISRFWETTNVHGDCVSGNRAVEGGGPPSKKVLKKAETVILDLQTASHRYWADTTRTFVVGGRPNREGLRAFTILLKSKKAAEAILKPGTKAREVFNAVNKVITDAGFHALPHHAGHGLGLDPQEAPFFIPADEEELREGMVCAVEPGIYDKTSGGIRIEDDYVITADGFEKISRFPLGLA